MWFDIIYSYKSKLIMKNILSQAFGKYIKTKLLMQLLCYIVPALIGVILSSHSAKVWILHIIPEWLHHILVNGWIQFILIIIGTVVIPCVIYSFIEYSEFRKKKSGYDILLCLITNIDNAVKLKRQRFRRIRENNYKSDKTIFRNITKPDLQIENLCEAICFIMRLWTNDEEVKSTVFYCKNNKLEDVLAICGEDRIKPKINELNNKSLAKYALQKRCSQIIDDVDKNDYFIKPYGCKAKSAFIIPIYDGGDAVFVICFTSPNTSCFDKSEIKRYEAVIDEISSRMMLEWHLYELLKQGENAQKK